MQAHAHFDLHRADDRGATDFGWLQSRHAFSFGAYRDPQRAGYRSLRVLNDDVVAPARGFGAHPHADMEIISWVLDGTLGHRDSGGHEGTIVPGDVQIMSAGRGIEHSEMNASATDPVHFLQIWIEPAERGRTPKYHQRSFPAEGRRDRWQLVGSPDARDGSLPIHQDAALRIADLTAGASLDAEVAAGRFGYLHVATGGLRIGDTELKAGDAVSWSGADARTLVGVADAQVLFFDLA